MHKLLIDKLVDKTTIISVVALGHVVLPRCILVFLESSATESGTNVPVIQDLTASINL